MSKEPNMELLKISTDYNDFNLNFICDYLLNESYWAKQRNREIIELSIKNSFCLAIFLKKEQVGFSRVVTDYATYAFIMDFFVSPKYQCLGYGKVMLDNIVDHEKLKYIRTFSLRTKNSEKFYFNNGFKMIDVKLMFKNNLRSI